MIRREVTGIVLAGGMSSRMGQDKSLMVFRGKPLISHAIEVLMPFCREVIISSNKAVYDFTHCPVWPDVPDVQSPMTGIYSCLKKSETEWNAVLSCDMPLADTRLFELMLNTCHDTDLVIPIHSGNCLEPLCGLYSKRLIPLLEEHLRIRDYSLQRVVRASKTQFLEVGPGLDFFRPDLFANINTPEDFNLFL